jgi:OmpA-OmpF porin, OOP family
MARYAAEGHTVYYATFTGMQDLAGQEGSPARAEVLCTSKALGVHDTFVMRGPAGEGFDAIGAIGERLIAIINQTKPGVIVTWGPDGLTGHPRHILVSNVVTRVFQQRRLVVFGSYGLTRRIRMDRRALCLGAVVAVTVLSAGIDAADAPGSRDHPLVKRYGGSSILRYSSQAFDEYVLPLGPVEGKREKAHVPKSVRLEGQVTRITYLVPAGRSTLEVLENYQAELAATGFVTLFSGGHQTLGQGQYDDGFSQLAYRGLVLPSSSNGVSFHNVVSHDDRFLAAKRARPEGDMHVAVYAVAITGGLVKFMYADPVTKKEPPRPGQVLVQVDVIETKPIESRMVTVSANEMAKGIAASGSVALYGILFDTNSAEVKGESKPTLEEVAKLLKSQPALKLLLVGHTDNVGTFEFNMDLSQRRAASVVQALTSKYAIPPSRLTPVGVSFSSPVASNKTADGRAKNRRVQLVENDSTPGTR